MSEPVAGLGTGLAFIIVVFVLLVIVGCVCTGGYF
ncbi:sporulation protein YjcZ [Bacillus carboniphilus]|uniref:Sporulation protein YjcZ n=1 Tax=Bacillus carboniphilus TaxID=86663 RepID=A0ABY9JYK3_9BACI|nr:sporulation protein YjcZ [Bacillus carboniphilus]WLR42706.1 sporulation protein YjcZ [Bacillus carboniphilus]